MPLHAVIDDLRRANARAASHGYGAGQIEAGRLIDEWSLDDVDRHAHEVLADVELAQAYAQAASTGYDDYASRAALVADGAPSPAARNAADAADAATAYQAGFDIGFAAALVEGCGVLLGRRRRAGATG